MKLFAAGLNIILGLLILVSFILDRLHDNQEGTALRAAMLAYPIFNFIAVINKWKWPAIVINVAVLIFLLVNFHRFQPEGVALGIVAVVGVSTVIGTLGD